MQSKYKCFICHRTKFEWRPRKTNRNVRNKVRLNTCYCKRLNANQKDCKFKRLCFAKAFTFNSRLILQRNGCVFYRMLLFLYLIHGLVFLEERFHSPPTKTSTQFFALASGPPTNIVADRFWSQSLFFIVHLLITAKYLSYTQRRLLFVLFPKTWKIISDPYSN